MHDRFIALDNEKRDRIINAAMREFSAKGYKNASTNQIVKNAGISKGALFHYFTSKQDLFEFLYRYSINFFINVAEPHIKEMPTDVFERWIAFAALKIEIAMQYPDMADFMQCAYREDTHETGGLLRNEFERFSNMFQQKINEGINLSKFRSDTDVTKALRIIWWVLEGFAVSKRKEPFDLSTIKTTDFIQLLTAEMESYLGMLRKSFYKTEYQE